MKTNKFAYLRHFRHLSAVLMAVIFALHFTPFWTLDDGSTVSIASYTWFPKDNKPMDKYIKSLFGNDLESALGNKVAVNNIGGWAILAVVFAVIGIALYLTTIKKNGSFLSDIANILCAFGAIMFINSPILLLGSTCTLHLILGILLLLSSLAVFFYHVVELRVEQERIWSIS